MMQIAVTSQNRRTISAHAGKCRHFWIYQVEEGALQSRKPLEISQQATFHANRDVFPDALANINVLITAGLGNSLYLRLRQRGILPIVTGESDPDQAISAYLNNELTPLSVIHNNDCHKHGE